MTTYTDLARILGIVCILSWLYLSYRIGRHLWIWRSRSDIPVILGTGLVAILLGTAGIVLTTWNIVGP